jgi:hypothetical protein
MRRDCERMAEVAAAVSRGAGLPAPPRLRRGAPERSREGGRAGDDADTDLQHHVDSCPSCADLVVVMSALRAERERVRRTTQVPAAGLVWWRAQLRQRQAAARATAAPVTAVHAATLALAVGAAVFLAWTAARNVGVPDAGAYLPALPAWLSASTTDGGTASSLTRYALALGAAAWLILAPVALYFALRRD